MRCHLLFRDEFCPFVYVVDMGNMRRLVRSVPVDLSGRLDLRRLADRWHQLDQAGLVDLLVPRQISPPDRADLEDRPHLLFLSVLVRLCQLSSPFLVDPLNRLFLVDLVLRHLLVVREVRVIQRQDPFLEVRVDL